ncbi:MAG: hypothetical protein ACRDY7_02380, partial [Acidimicrobiia bacterium]
MTTEYGGDRVASATQPARGAASEQRELASAQGTSPPSKSEASADRGVINTRGSNALRRILVLLDATALAVGWTVALLVPDGFDQPGVSRAPHVAFALLLATVISLALIASQRLY